MLHAPCDGEIVIVDGADAARGDAARRHGAEVLMHVGIDTVALRGEGFEALVAAGERVRAGEPLLRFDLDAVARRAPSLRDADRARHERRAFEIVRGCIGRAVAVGELLHGAAARRSVAAPRRDGAGATTAGRELRRAASSTACTRGPAALVARRCAPFDAERERVAAHGRRAMRAARSR